ncbi:hypothetical protein [Maledivibacter halophilus]|uniref:Serine/threonine protein kinase n=1 Tax=Maledivibacter halophilus TaxID=36842 RepID=A0A1T5L1V9_9FIRM|nr:hypothetical protein [Maledivibacter halophilus]SKC70017.1 hypothetical protein SAMN02194393_02360 [Maledivibacter halophilus]
MGKKIFGINVMDLNFIGKGVEGKVFLTPNGEALKVYRNTSLCKREYKILKMMEGNKYFPKVIKCKGKFMLREYIEGVPIKEYIEKNGLSKNLAHNLIEFAKEFEELKLRLDGVSKHVFIEEDESIKVVDPRRKKHYMHKSILRTLKKLGVIDKYLKVLEEEEPNLRQNLDKYIKNIILR